MTPALVKTPSTRQAALFYADLGWPIFPVWPMRDGACGCGKPDCANPGKHPVGGLALHGFKDATTDRDRINRWWNQYPDANIGLATGAASGVFAIDIDPRHNGADTWQDLEAAHGPIPDTVEQETGGGGRHILFKHVAGLGNSGGALGPGIDTRGEGGYILLPPSNHISGRRYEWEVSSRPEDVSLADAPAWLLSLLTPQTGDKAAATFSSNGKGNGAPDLTRFNLSELIRVTIRQTPDLQADRSSIDQSVITALVRGGATDDDILAVYEHYPIGKDGKFAEKGGHGPGYLAHSITRARAYVKGVATPNEDKPQVVDTAGGDWPPAADAPLPDLPDLPEAARIAPSLGAGACPWLDEYIAFSRTWSPRAFDHFHEAVGLWVLSTVAARRVLAHLGKPRYPSLYITLTGRTSMYAKSSTAEIGLQVINDAGLGWLLAADSATPQKFVKDLTATLPDDYNQLGENARASVKNRLALAGQRGWYHDEFGQHVAAMMREGGFMADFRGLLRRFDDAPANYEYGTVGRGTDRVTRPYLALLANMTPSDLAPFARKGAALWGDGFLARFATITPPEGERQRARFPDGARVIPPPLLKGVREWHERLGMPPVTISDTTGADGNPAGRTRATVGEPHITVLGVPPDVGEAFYAYHDGLLDITQHNETHDLDGNYARLAEKALRVAILFASVTNAPALTLTHWAAAQCITERWRMGLHELYAQVGRGVSEQRDNEDAITRVLGRLGGAGTANDIKRYVRGLSASEITHTLDGLCASGVAEVVEMTNKHTKRYALVGG